MDGKCYNASYCLYNSRKDTRMADYDNWSWVFDINENTWTTSDPAFAGRTLSKEEVNGYVNGCSIENTEGSS